jgi:hypothetical protein
MFRTLVAAPKFELLLRIDTLLFSQFSLQNDVLRGNRDRLSAHAHRGKALIIIRSYHVELPKNLIRTRLLMYQEHRSMFCNIFCLCILKSTKGTW